MSQRTSRPYLLFRNVDTVRRANSKFFDANDVDDDDGVTVVVGDDNEAGGVLCVVFCRSRGKNRRRRRVRFDEERRARGITSRIGLTGGTIARDQSSIINSNGRRGRSKGRSWTRVRG